MYSKEAFCRSRTEVSSEARALGCSTLLLSVAVAIVAVSGPVSVVSGSYSSSKVKSFSVMGTTVGRTVQPNASRHEYRYWKRLWFNT